MKTGVNLQHVNGDSMASTEVTNWNEGPPPAIGWWNARIRGAPDIVARFRRFWDGTHWSVFVQIGVTSDADCERAKRRKTMLQVRAVQWQGLVEEPEHA